MSKQTLSAIVKKLETEMNAVFLIRTSGGVELTPEGRCLYEYAVQMLAQWEQCRQAVEHAKELRRGALTVGFAYMSWNLWTEDARAAFERENPDVELTAHSALSRELLPQLDDGQCDVVVTCMQLERYAQYESVLLANMEISALMRQNDPLAGKAVLSPQDLAGRKLLYPESGVEFLRRFGQFLKTQGVEAELELLPAGNFLGNLKAVREREAICLTNGVYRAVAPGIDGYVYRPLRHEGDAPMPGIAIHALMRRGEARSSAAMRFIAFFRRMLDAQTEK